MAATAESKSPTVVPTSVLRAAGIGGGNTHDFKASGKVITILPDGQESNDDYTPAQRKAIDRGIAQSERRYTQGKSYGPFDTADAAITALNANLRRRSRAKKLKSTVR